MTSELSKWERAIQKLVEFTQDNKLDWKIVAPETYLPKEDTNNAMLLVEHDGRHLLLYRKAYMRSVPGNFLSVMAGEVREVKDYRSALCIYNIESKTVVYSFPYSELTEDLYKAATFNAAGVEEFISGLLESNAR